MENYKDPASVGNLMYNTRNSLLPPKIPFPSIAPAYVNYVPSSAIGQKGAQKSREGNSHHQRTSSESQLIEEQPSWLDELLNEPETPVRRGSHRRSSSDSFAYIDVANAINLDYVTQTENKFRHIAPLPSWAPQDFDHPRDAQHASFVPEPNSFGKQKNRAWDANLNNAHSRGVLSPCNMVKNAGSLRAQQELEVVPTIASEKEDILESVHHDSKGSSEKKDSCHSKPAASETDTKRAKQQFAQRSRVRKLQYIAELERNVQALQVEGSEVSAELEFLNQQSLILSMENKALKQRLESLAQEQIIKYLEHEVLEKEIVRLRALYQKQQQPPPQSQPTSGHRRKSSKDLDQQLANLSLKQKDASSARDNISGQLHI